MSSQHGCTCIKCGYEFAPNLGECPLWSSNWQGWELLFAPLPLGDLRGQVMGWLGQLPFPSVLEWTASPMGLRVRLYAPPQTAEGVVPFLQPVFNTHFLSLAEWVVVVGLAFVPAIAEEITKAYLRWREARPTQEGI